VTFDGENAAGDAAGFVPDFDGETAGADFERIAAGQQRNGIFAVFKGGRAAAGGKKGFDSGEEFGGFGISRVQLIVVAESGNFRRRKGFWGSRVPNWLTEI
jgi:hypothetical protein